MKKINIAILTLLVAIAACKKVPEVNLKYVDVERDLITVGTTTATVQCDYQYIATLKKAYLSYGEGQDEADMNTAEMRVVQNTLYVDLAGLKSNTTYSYYYEFHNGFNSMRTVAKTFKTEGTGTTITLPTVVTAEVAEITTNSANGGGEVTNDGGAEVTERGICWSTSENPTLSDNHVASGTGMGAFTAMMDNLEANTTYHVRAYATNEKGTAYGLDREFETDNGGGCDCGYVDLGLPSGTLWATCNVGAGCPEEYGDYFAWGETETKDIYNWITYKYCNGSDTTFTKYCESPYLGYNGFVDNLFNLLSEDDAATVNLGPEWRTPGVDEWRELYQNTANFWTTQNGVNGRLFTASNGNSLFLPASGGRYENSLGDVGNSGYYWSNFVVGANSHSFAFNSDNYTERGNSRYLGYSVRPVHNNGTPTPPGNIPEGAINGLFTINDNGDQVYFSQGNLQYQASTNTWRFAEHQWDYVGGTGYSGYHVGNVNGSSNDNISQTYEGWIDLFGFGTSGYNHGAICYQPWSINQTWSNYFAYGDAIMNLYDGNGKADWGYNPIYNGGNQEKYGWRTLTCEEWNYVFEQRITSSGIHYAKATVNDIYGIILLPDNWNANIYLYEADTYDADYNNNIFDNLQWSNMEASGAVFLPVTGYRQGTSLLDETRGYYWSSIIFMGETDGTSAYAICFSDWDCGCYCVSYRYYGNSVRLVQDAN